MDLGWFQTISTGVIHSYVLVEQPIQVDLSGQCLTWWRSSNLTIANRRMAPSRASQACFPTITLKPANRWNFDDYEAGKLLSRHYRLLAAKYHRLIDINENQ